jgi:hypothetical protein
MWLRNIVILLGLLTLSFTMQPQSINGTPNQNVTVSGVSGVPSTCAQLPCVVFASQQPGLTVGTGTVNVYTPTGPGTYLIDCSMYVSTVATAGNMVCGASWKTVTGGAISSASGNNPLMTTLANTSQLSALAHVGGTDPIGVFTTLNAVTGSPVYELDIVVIRVQ